MNGTPKTLSGAIANAIGQKSDGTYDVTLHKNIQNNVHDYLAQKFAKATLLMDMWRDGSSTKMTPEEILKQLWSEVV